MFSLFIFFTVCKWSKSLLVDQGKLRPQKKKSASKLSVILLEKQFPNLTVPFQYLKSLELR